VCPLKIAAIVFSNLKINGHVLETVAVLTVFDAIIRTNKFQTSGM
jgi:hypothetical protein